MSYSLVLGLGGVGELGWIHSHSVAAIVRRRSHHRAARVLHLRSSGFEVPPIAEPVGQSANWVLSLTDGSRLHVHEYANGVLVAHRDETDPKRGPLHAAWHWATESKSGKLVVGGTIAVAVVYALAQVFGDPKQRR